MATYQATNLSSKGFTREIGNVVQEVGAVWNLGTTALALNDVLAGPFVPKNARIIGIMLCASDCDSGTTLVLDVGDSGDTDRLIDGATIGQAGGVSTALVPTTGIGYKYTADTQINVLIQAAATGAGSGELITLKVEYIVDQETA